MVGPCLHRRCTNASPDLKVTQVQLKPTWIRIGRLPLGAVVGKVEVTRSRQTDASFHDRDCLTCTRCGVVTSWIRRRAGGMCVT
jgi:hypothetical protein